MAKVKLNKVNFYGNLHVKFDKTMNKEKMRLVNSDGKIISTGTLSGNKFVFRTKLDTVESNEALVKELIQEFDNIYVLFDGTVTIENGAVTEQFTIVNNTIQE